MTMMMIPRCGRDSPKSKQPIEEDEDDDDVEFESEEDGDIEVDEEEEKRILRRRKKWI